MADRVLASRFAVRAVELIEEGQSGRVVGVNGNDIIDKSVIEALKCKKQFDEKNPQHKIIVCGDLLDRGSGAKQVQAGLSKAASARDAPQRPRHPHP